MLSFSLSSCVLFISVQLRIYKTVIWYWCGAYSKDKDYFLLRYDVVFIGTSMPTSRRNLLSDLLGSPARNSALEVEAASPGRGF